MAEPHVAVIFLGKTVSKHIHDHWHQQVCFDVIKWQSLTSLHSLMVGPVGAFLG